MIANKISGTNLVYDCKSKSMGQIYYLIVKKISRANLVYDCKKISMANLVYDYEKNSVGKS